MTERSTTSRMLAVAARVNVDHPARLGPGSLTAYWSLPAENRWAVGLGVASERFGQIDWLRKPEIALTGPWFGGWAFDPERLWTSFPSERWVLPEVLVWSLGGETWGAAFGDADSASEETLLARLAMISETPLPPGERGVRVTGSNKASYLDLVEQALAQIEQGGFTKVVVARKIDLTSTSEFDPRNIIECLERRFPACRVFLIAGQDGAAFLGASPELLCFSDGHQFQSEAVAGTSAPELAEELLESQKDLYEHRLTVNGIVAALEATSVKVEVAPRPVLRRLANVAHLITPVRATLGAGVDALTAAKALHPTPAVAGNPRQAALEFLRQHEGFARGWYAGAVGVTGPVNTELAVGLRSALVKRNTASLFAGAGIVCGSVPDLEWLETERKLEAMLDVMGGAVG